MRHKKAAVCCLLILMAAALFADDWVLAAEAFSGDEAVGTLMPSLILDSIPASLVRSVSDREQIFRELLSLEKEQASYSSSLDKLLRERDSVIFTTKEASARRDKIADYEKKIAQERERLQENLEQQEKVESGEVVFEHLEENVVLWKKDSGSLYTKSGTSEPTDIRALITGSVQVRQGFMYVKAGLVIYPGTIVCNEVVAAGTIADAADIAEELASAFVDTIVNATPVSLKFSIEPAVAKKKAEVTVDGMPVQNPEMPHNYQSGIHTITIEAPGYEKQMFTRDFSDATQYQIDAFLPLQNSVNLQLTALSPDGTTAEDATVWIAGKNAGIAPANVTVNGRQVLGLLQGPDGVPTYFALDTGGRNMSANILMREESSQSRIEKSRKNLYTSYGLLLMSLPFTFYFYGRMNDAAYAYNQGLQLQSLADDFKKWQILERISLGVTIGCGGNMIYRLIKYMIDADSVLPEKEQPPEKDSK